MSRMDIISESMQKAAPKIMPVLPPGVSFDRLMRTAQMAISQNAALIQCTKESLLVAFMEAARLGLEIGGPVAGCYLVPYKKKATLVLSYRGLLDLAYRSGAITKGQARPVFENDFFEYELGLEETLKHIPAADPDNRGELTYAYCILSLPTGERIFEVMSKFDIERVRLKAHGSSKPDSPWVVWYDRMALKTVVKYTVSRWVRTDPTISAALDIDTRQELGTEAPTLAVVLDDEPAPPPPTKTETLREQLASQTALRKPLPDKGADVATTDEIDQLLELMNAAVGIDQLGIEESELWDGATRDPVGSTDLIRKGIEVLKERLALGVDA